MCTPTVLWCTKRVKSTDTGRPVFQKYGSTRKNTGRPVNLRVDPYFRYGSTRIFAGRPVNIRVDPYICGSTRIFTGLLAFTGRPVIYGSTRILRVDPYLRYGSTREYTGRPGGGGAKGMLPPLPNYWGGGLPPPPCPPPPPPPLFLRLCKSKHVHLLRQDYASWSRRVHTHSSKRMEAIYL